MPHLLHNFLKFHAIANYAYYHFQLLIQIIIQARVQEYSFYNTHFMYFEIDLFFFPSHIIVTHNCKLCCELSELLGRAQKIGCRL